MDSRKAHNAKGRCIIPRDQILQQNEPEFPIVVLNQILRTQDINGRRDGDK
jgi:hypothetical protein